MRIAFTHNFKLHDTVEEAEFDTAETVQAIAAALEGLGHEVHLIDVSGPASRLVARLESLRPSLVFNTAEGEHGRYREAFYPALFEQLRLPFTGSDAYACAVALDKQATKRMVGAYGVPSPKSLFVDANIRPSFEELQMPVIVKPNFEGSSKGVTQESVVVDREQLGEVVEALLAQFESGLIVEEFVEGVDVTVPYLEAGGGVLDAASYVFDAGDRAYSIYDYKLKNKESQSVHVQVPAQIPAASAEAACAYTRRVVEVLGLRDMGRVDFRVTPTGQVFFIEANALPSLEPGASIYACAALKGFTTVKSVLDRIIESACVRQGVDRASTSTAAGYKVGLTYNLKRVNPAGGDDREAEYDSPSTVAAVRAAIERAGHEVVELEATAELMTILPASGIDMVFNIAEGLSGRNREAQIPAMLELLGIEYTGSDPATLAITLDKALAKRLVREAGIPTAPFLLMRTGDEPLPEGFPFPAIVKPNAEGSSKGVSPRSVVRTEEELRTCVRDLAGRYTQPMLVEGFLTGREFTIAVLGETEPRALPAMEIVFLAGAGELPVYSFDHKQETDLSVRNDTPAKVDPELNQLLLQTALDCFETLGCRDVARIDLRCDARGIPHFIECNPLPGLTPGWSDLCLIANSIGMSYESLIQEIMTPALRRLHVQRQG